VKSRAGVSARGSGYPEVIPHSDGAGIIDKIGQGVNSALLGQRVWVFNGQWDRPFGTAAEFITLPVAQTVALPNNLSFEIGASIAIPLMTAMHSLQSCGSLIGKTVLIPGAAGSVGFYATQLARMAGAHVIAIVSNEQKAQLAKDIGAHDVINYKTESVTDKVHALTNNRGADAIIDVDAATHAPLYGSLLTFDGKAVVYGSNQPQVSMPFGPMIMGFISIYYFIVYKLPQQAMHEVLAGVNAALAAPGFKHPPTSIYPLADIVNAHQQVERGANAKVLIQL
jgi:NADPH2:quinone reductase